MKKFSKVLKIIVVALCSVLLTSLCFGFIMSNRDKTTVRTVSVNTAKYDSAISKFSEEIDAQQAQIDVLADRSFTQLYSHHFDVVLTLDQAFGALASTVAVYGGASYVGINFNVMSNNSTPYETLSDMDGDGYIASAFGVYMVGGSPAFVFNAQLVYDGNIVIYVTNMSDSSVVTLVVPNMGNFVVEDSVSVI